MVQSVPIGCLGHPCAGTPAQKRMRVALFEHCAAYRELAATGRKGNAENTVRSKLRASGRGRLAAFGTVFCLPVGSAHG